MTERIQVLGFSGSRLFRALHLRVLTMLERADNLARLSGTPFGKAWDEVSKDDGDR